MNYLRLYGKYIVLCLKSRMEYRFSFVMDVLVHVFIYVLTYLSLWVVFQKFNSIAGWSFYEVMFLFNLNLFSYGICCMFLWSPMQRLESMVRQGTFDSMLVRPIIPFWHLIFRQFNHCFFGHILLALIVFTISITHLSITWSIQKALFLLIVIIGGVLIQSGIMVAAGSMNFWFVRANSAVDTAIYGLRAFLDYPITIYARWVQVVLTFIIPYAFVNFYPAGLFIQKGKTVLFHPLLQYGTPLVGILVFAGAMRIWALGIRRYQSTGS